MGKRSKKFWLLLSLTIVVVGGVIAYVVSRRAPGPTYDLITAARRDVTRVVSVTGRVEPATEVALAFEVSGRVARVPAVVGARVAAGAELVALDGADLQAEQQQRVAALAQARAELAELRAGTRPEEVRITEADVANAQRALTDAESTFRETAAKAAVDLDGSYRAVPNTLRDAYAKADDAVRRQTDDLFTNDATESPQLTFQTSDYQAEIDTEQRRRATELVLRQWAGELPALPESNSGRDAALVSATARLQDILTFLERTLDAVNGATNISATTVASYKTSVSTGRTNVNTARTAVEDLQQAIAARRAANDTALAAARADVTTKRNVLVAAEAKLTLARAGATAEQLLAAEAHVAAAEANVASAGAAFAKRTLRAPFSGIVTVQDAKMGATVTPGIVMVRVISDAGFEVKVHVPEVDLPGIAVTSPAQVTLDAYGSAVGFGAAVTAIDPAATIIEGVPTYRTTLAFAERDERIRAGMTANVDMVVGKRSGVIAIPQRAVITRDGATFVRTQQNGIVTEAAVHLGLKGSDGYVEITEGLTEGAVVVRSEQNPR